MNARDPLLPLQADEAEALGRFAERVWDDEIVPALTDYIAVPAKSPMFDAEWQRARLHRPRRARCRGVGRAPARRRAEARGDPPRGPHAGDLLRRAGHPPGRQRRRRRDDLPLRPPRQAARVQRLEERLRPVDAALRERPALRPRRRRRRLCDLRRRSPRSRRSTCRASPRPRCVGLIETCEESGSPDLPFYVDALRERLGHIGLVVCLDSGAGNYDQLWLTTSLRGNVTGTLKVEILTEGVHSGDASGLVPSSFRILRQVLDRLEDSKTGRLLPESFHCAIPADRIEQAKATAQILGDEVWKRFPWACGADGGPTLPTTTDPVEALVNRTWRPTLSVTGVDGMPALKDAGNVLRPYTAFKLSLRTPPLVDGDAAAQALKALLEDNAPYNAKVTFHARRPPGTKRRVGRHRLERAEPRALARGRAARGLAGALRRALRLHRPGRHDPADEHAAAELPEGADDGLRRARPEEQCARPERVPARALRQEAHRGGRAGDGGLRLERERAAPRGDCRPCQSPRTAAPSIAQRDRLGDLDAVDRRRHDPAGIARAFAGRIEAAHVRRSAGPCRACMRNGDEVRVSTPVSTASSIAKPAICRSNAGSASRIASIA